MSTPTPTNITDQSPNSSLVGPTTTNDNHDVIGFVSEGSQPPLNMNYSALSELQTSSVGDHHHDIADFLSRPISIFQGTLDAQNITGNVIAFEDVLVAMIRSSPVIAKKLDAFYAIRGQFNLRLVINQTPFQTGLYMLMVTPVYMTESTETFTRTDYEPSVMGLKADSVISNWSGHPNVLLNIGATSEVTLSVPYVGPRSYCSLSEINTLCYRVVCIEPVRGPTNGEKINFSLYAWIDGAELMGTTSSTLKQAGYYGQNINDVIPHSSPQLISQIQALLSQLTSPSTPSQTEEAAQATAPAGGSSSGAVSGIADSVGNIASALTAIPGVADIAGPVSWVAKGVGSVAKMFGFSKPHSTAPSMPIHQDPFHEFAHVNSVSTATKLSCDQNSSTVSRSLGPVSEDEMAISYLVQRPILFKPIQWKLSQPKGTLLHAHSLSPSTYFSGSQYNISTNGLQTVVYHTILSFLSSMFLFYRGSIKYTFTICANKFYSGRLRIVYVLDQATGIDPTEADIAKDYGAYYSKIIDIRDADTFTVEFPYIDVNPWRNTTINNSKTGTCERTPAIYIYVEVPLVASSTVADTISIWYSVSGGKDFIFSGPRNTSRQFLLPPCTGIVTPAKSVFEEVIPHGFTDNQNAELTPAEISMTENPPPHANAAAHLRAVGDPIVSLRSLIKRPTYNAHVDLKADTIYTINPWLSTQDISAAVTDTFFAKIRSLYRFSSGALRVSIRGLPPQSIRFKLFDLTDSDLAGKFYNLANSGWSEYVVAGIPAKSAFNVLPTIADVIYREDLQGFAHFEIPYYTIYEMLDNTMVPDLDSDAQPKYRQYKCPNIALAFYSATQTSDVTYYVSAADDFSLGYLMGPPLTFGQIPFV